MTSNRLETTPEGGDRGRTARIGTRTGQLPSGEAIPAPPWMRAPGFRNLRPASPNHHPQLPVVAATGGHRRWWPGRPATNWILWPRRHL